MYMDQDEVVVGEITIYYPDLNGVWIKRTIKAKNTQMSVKC